MKVHPAVTAVLLEHLLTKVFLRRFETNLLANDQKLSEKEIK